ncbi:MAG: hypothetical protein WBZ35_21980, partial [Pseudolabrys sp.]
CFVGSSIKSPKRAAECFPTHPLAACLVGNFSTISAYGGALPVNHSEATRTGSEYHNAPIRGLVSAKPSDVSVGL